MAVPYQPTAFATPIINPAIGGTGVNPVPYISVSQYKYAPTAMDTSTLEQGGSQQSQDQALFDTIRRACRWADRYCFGADPAAKGASLAATLSVESARVKMLRGELRLVCDYKPIVEVVGIDVGLDPSNVSTVGPTIAAQTRVGRRTLFVPVGRATFGNSDPTLAGIPADRSWDGSLYAVWSYVNGYPHTKLAHAVAANDVTVQVTPVDGNGGLYGVYPGTQMTVVDGVATETVTVTTVTPGTGTNPCVIGCSAFANNHTLPSAGPDFLPVTALPEDIELAVIFFTTALIKTRGDNSLVLDEVQEADHLQGAAGDVQEDVAYAMELLDAYRVRIKGHN